MRGQDPQGIGGGMGRGILLFSKECRITKNMAEGKEKKLVGKGKGRPLRNKDNILPPFKNFSIRYRLSLS